MAESFDVLLTTIAQQEQEISHLKRQLLTENRQEKSAQEINSELQVQLRTLQTLTSGLFSLLEPEQIYHLVCESLVHQLGWDTAFVVSLTGQHASIHASYQATQKQLGHITDYLHQTQPFVEGYLQHAALTTYNSQDKASLALRVLFQTDEVAAMPMLFGEHLFGYLVACTHTHKNRGKARDLDFLATMASAVGQAVQNSNNFRSLEAQNIKLRTLDELKNSFISITSHQLRTPLSIIKWILSILQSDPDMLKLEKQHTLIDQAYDSNERLIHVVNDLLNVSRIEEGRLPINKQPADLGAILKDLCNSSQHLADSRKVHLSCGSLENLPPIEVDTILFREALQNLVDNAIDYNFEDGFVQVMASVENEMIKIAITNSGPGMSQEEGEKIFDQFYRSPTAVKIHPDGNGLGLYLARAILREHAGDIKVASQPEKETIFTVTLPTSK